MNVISELNGLCLEEAKQECLRLLFGVTEADCQTAEDMRLSLQVQI
jgi:hypothetical protein